MASPTRVSLNKHVRTAEVEEVAALLDASPQQAAPPVEDEKQLPTTTSTINLPQELLEALQRTAFKRAWERRRASPKGRGGRASVSAIVVEILEETRGQWELKD